MEDLILKDTEQLAEALLLLSADGDLPLPFEEDIFLYGAPVAGVMYVPDYPAIFDSLEVGEEVRLVREPENEYDEYAVRLDVERDGGFHKIGYIPRSHNRIFARLMDAGKYLYGKVRVAEYDDQYPRAVVKIYMKD